MQALGDALDLKDRETEGHSRRVTAFTMAIARAMGLPPDQVATIARGAFLHDIGKMAIPDNILNKPGKLDAHETLIMREHCYKGYQIVKKIPFLKEACDIVYSHQEHYDGTGYPAGPEGERDSAGGADLFGCGHARRNYFRSGLPSGSDRCKRRARRFKRGLAASLIRKL